METTEKNKTLFKVVAIDETQYWDEALQQRCGTISTVYLFDAGVVNYCCSPVAMYALTPLYYITDKDIDDNTAEILQNTFNEVETEIRYFTVTDINKMKTVDVNNNIEFDTSESEEYREHFDELEEYCKCNHQI